MQSRDCELHVIDAYNMYLFGSGAISNKFMEDIMKAWTRPEVREQEVGLEVTSYLPAEIDLI